MQQTVRTTQTTGIVGEIIFDGPQRAEPMTLLSADAANNVIGRAFSQIAGVDGYAEAGGTGVFAGILVNPLVYASRGPVGGEPLDPTLVLPNEALVELLKMGTIIVELTTAANIGDDVHYDQATGELSAVAPGTAPDPGFSAVPNCKVVRQNIPGAGLAFVQLTN